MNSHKQFEGHSYTVVLEINDMWVGYRTFEEDFVTDVEIVDWSPKWKRKTVVSQFLLSAMIGRFVYEMGDSVKHTPLGELSDVCSVISKVQRVMEEVTHDVSRDGSHLEEEGRAPMVDYFTARFA
jgi:hypothetical protein